MHLLSILILIVGGAVGVWYGFVEDIELAFLAGITAWATATVGVFRGSLIPPDDLSDDVRTGALTVLIVGLLVLGAAAAWMAFVEEIKISMLVAVVAWGAATFFTFSGNRGLGGASAGTTASGTLGLAVLVLGGLAAGAVGVWYGLVEDVELGFAAGILIWAATTITTFRGKIALN